MKMKAVCEATGLTDRTIRYYIEENLISPAYTENYLGRKTFDFSESDIQQLNDIAVLRKFGFTIAEIREMFLHPECIIRISKALQARKQTTVNEELSLLSALSRLDTARSYTVSELAAFLSKPVCETPLPAEDSGPALPLLILSFIKKSIIFLITWQPVSLAVKAVFDYYHRYQFPVINGRTFIMLAVLILPTALILLASKLKLKTPAKRFIQTALLILCVLATPLTYYFTCFAFSVSETSNHHHYRRLDAYCPAARDGIFQDLFPAWPEYSDPKYYYCYSETLFGDTCDIYAEWALDEDEFAAEVSRVQMLYENYSATTNHVTVQKGNFTCLILYFGSPPFEPATEVYSYYVFGYDEQAKIIRYIYCNSQMNGADQPYYLTLEW